MKTVLLNECTGSGDFSGNTFAENKANTDGTSVFLSGNSIATFNKDNLKSGQQVNFHLDSRYFHE